VLIPGADGRGWYWHRVVPLLNARGHEAVPVDLPVTDPAAGLKEYAAAVASALGDRPDDVILVAQSLGGFIAPLVADRIPVTGIILVNAMVPRPGESVGEWWVNTGHEEARAQHYANQSRALPSEFDPIEAFFHDVPSDVVEQAMAMGEQPVRFDRLFSEPWPLSTWPAVPTRFIPARNDRFFPIEFQRRVVAERLGIPVEEMDGGHLVALSQPQELVNRLVR
jgi:pimeloyl-ACP methyl ester carboxylesterase